jgi:sterol desaturase/sphingolipid hydroxylase (fatty acid hydroxylase superfamily)
MMMDFLVVLGGKVQFVLVAIGPSVVAFAVVLAALTPFPTLACNPGKPWWRNRGLITDLCYCFILPLFTPYMRLAPLMLGGALIIWLADVQDLDAFFTGGHGPIAALAFWLQCSAYLLLSDFLLYWVHRLFHGEGMWRYHAIHHSAEDVDWTTAYRFHPINLWLGPFLVDAFMVLIGVPLIVLAFLAPFSSVMSAFVHANLNCTLGPLKYVLASPVFHRWHHTSPAEGGNKNFAPTFAFWDVLFGTFYMPKEKRPENYGVDDPAFPAGFGGQLVYPFRREPGAPRTKAGVAANRNAISLRR